MRLRINISVATDQKGFTLIEAVVAIAILSIVMLGTASMLFTTLSTSSGSNNRFTATTIAQSTMEDLMTKPFANVSSHLTPIATTTNGIQYGTRWRFANITTNVGFINISTTWTDKTGRHGVSISSARAR